MVRIAKNSVMVSTFQDFAFYSPGMLLINEAIKFFIEETNIRNLDLSQGEEMYKYKMGGITHQTHNFEIKLR